MWHKIKFNSQNIKGGTAKAVLIQLPNKSRFKGMHFYHPSKLVRDEGHKGYLKSFSFTEEWEFRLYKNGEHVDTVGVDEMYDAFDNPQLNNTADDDYYLIVEEPTKVDKEVSVCKELMKEC